jgi:tRNA-binding EMAP/Myf-like protein
MPISLREAGNTEFTTQATLSLVNLATHIADPLRRLRAIRDAAGAVKSVARRAKAIIPTDFPSIGVPWLIGGLASLYGKTGIADAIPPIANVAISNVPGPPVTLYVAGLPMRAYWPLSIVEHGLGVNITVMSYAGSLDFGIVVARNAVPDARKLAQALLDAGEELTACTLPEPAAGATPKPAARRKSASPKP